MPPRPVLHLICGMAGAGKSTLARGLARSTGAVRLSPDEWIVDLMRDPGDRAELDRLRDPVEKIQCHMAHEMLSRGVSVILENGFWSPHERAAYRSQAQRIGSDVILHYLDVEHAELLRRLAIRNATAPRALKVSPEDLALWTTWFTPPDEAEMRGYDGFEIYRAP